MCLSEKIRMRSEVFCNGNANEKGFCWSTLLLFSVFFQNVVFSCSFPMFLFGHLSSITVPVSALGSLTLMKYIIKTFSLIRLHK